MSEGVSVIVPTAEVGDQPALFNAEYVTPWESEGGNRLSEDGKYVEKVLKASCVKAEVGIGKSRDYIYFKDGERTIMDRDWLEGIRANVEQVAKGLSVGGESNSNLLAKLQDELSAKEKELRDAAKTVEKQKQEIASLKASVAESERRRAEDVNALKVALSDKEVEIGLKELKIEELRKNCGEKAKPEVESSGIAGSQVAADEVKPDPPCEMEQKVDFNMPYGGTCDRCAYWHSAKCAKPMNAAKNKSRCYTVVVSKGERAELVEAMSASADGILRMVEGRTDGRPVVLVDEVGDRVVVEPTVHEEGEW